MNVNKIKFQGLKPSDSRCFTIKISNDRMRERLKPNETSGIKQEIIAARYIRYLLSLPKIPEDYGGDTNVELHGGNFFLLFNEIRQQRRGVQSLAGKYVMLEEAEENERWQDFVRNEKKLIDETIQVAQPYSKYKDKILYLAKYFGETDQTKENRWLKKVTKFLPKKFSALKKSLMISTYKQLEEAISPTHGIDAIEVVLVTELNKQLIECSRKMREYDINLSSLGVF